MFTITNGFAFLAFLMLLAGGILLLQHYTNWKVFSYVPPIVWIYVINMLLCTAGLYDSKACAAVYSGVKDDLFYAMLFVMLQRCDFRCLAKLGSRMISVFLGATLTLSIGTVVAFLIFMNPMGGAEQTWAAASALFASWVGGSANMSAIGSMYSVDAEIFRSAVAVDTVCYCVWFAFLLLSVRAKSRWNRAVEADTSGLDAVAQAALPATAEPARRASTAEWIFLLGLSMVVSAISQVIGSWLNHLCLTAGLTFFPTGTCTTFVVAIFGLIGAMTRLGKLPARDELSNLYLYAVISLLASQASLTALVDAPIWIAYGFAVLLIHGALLFFLAKLFRWDLCLVSTASLANVGGTASAPIVATAYNPAFAGVGILMAVLGAAIANFCGVGMAAVLQLFT